MTHVETTAVTPAPAAIGASAPYVQWGPVVAGAIAAAALAFVLHAFAVSLGLAVGSAAPTWRDASAVLWLASGLYLILVALVAYGLGGYIAGRTRTRLAGLSSDETEMRDGTHGLLVWGLATLMTGLLALALAQAAPRLAAPSAGEAGPATSVAGENIIAYDLDRLFRAEKRPQGVDLEYARAEAARILLTAAGHRGITADDRTYLVRLTGRVTGLDPAEAEKRVAAVLAQSRENIQRARRAAILVGFMAGAAALLGAVAAWFAAVAGGMHRDAERPPSLWWPRRLASA
jgi:hypothetical protein